MTSDIGKYNNMLQEQLELANWAKAYVKSHYAKPLKHIIQINKLVKAVVNSNGVSENANSVNKFYDYITDILGLELDELPPKSNRTIDRIYDKKK